MRTREELLKELSDAGGKEAVWRALLLEVIIDLCYEVRDIKMEKYIEED